VSPQLLQEEVPSIPQIVPPPHRARRARVAFFGIFGFHNIGNECTLQSILQGARRYLPGSEIYAVSFDPADTLRRHGVPAVPVTKQTFNHPAKSGLLGRLYKPFRILRRIKNEFVDWASAVKALRGTNLVVMTGTGMLTDYATSALGFPYHVFRWTAAARLAGCRVRFVGVGVGPIYEKLSRWFITKALSLADYRSFRDQNSKDRIRKNGFIRDEDPVFPDLVFSLSKESLGKHSVGDGNVRQVGLGVMDHRDVHMWSDEEHQAQYTAYLQKMCEFIQWLVSNKYSVRLLQGDSKHDAGTRADLKALLAQRGIEYRERGITDEGSEGVEELIAQIAQVDIVVSPRFHNLLLGLMMDIPAISISYDPKNDCLLEGVGLGDYRQALTELDVKKLIEQFTQLTGRIDEVKPLIAEKSTEYRALLEDQYELIFGEFAVR
jgi:polysaccharide pyruvyl transferase WcaK-like protein